MQYLRDAGQGNNRQRDLDEVAGPPVCKSRRRRRLFFEGHTWWTCQKKEACEAFPLDTGHRRHSTRPYLTVWVFSFFKHTYSPSLSLSSSPSSPFSNDSLVSSYSSNTLLVQKRMDEHDWPSVRKFRAVYDAIAVISGERQKIGCIDDTRSAVSDREERSVEQRGVAGNERAG